MLGLLHLSHFLISPLSSCINTSITNPTTPILHRLPEHTPPNAPRILCMCVHNHLSPYFSLYPMYRPSLDGNILRTLSSTHWGNLFLTPAPITPFIFLVILWNTVFLAFPDLPPDFTCKFRCSHTYQHRVQLLRRHRVQLCAANTCTDKNSTILQNSTIL